MGVGPNGVQLGGSLSHVVTARKLDSSVREKEWRQLSLRLTYRSSSGLVAITAQWLFALLKVRGGAKLTHP
jgi:hypothetical protein